MLLLSVEVIDFAARPEADVVVELAAAVAARHLVMVRPAVPAAGSGTAVLLFLMRNAFIDTWERDPSSIDQSFRG